MGMGNLMPIKGAQQPPKASQSRMETLILTREMINQWRLPACQRPLRVNEKVKSLAKELEQTEEIKGIITLGALKGNDVLYIVDGQHRIEGFRISDVDQVFADIRVVVFDNEAQLSEEFVELNRSLVKMRPDDILRGMESYTPILKKIRDACNFVGYDQIRRNGSGPVVSMSSLLRSWDSAQYETPSTFSKHGGIAGLVETVDEKSLRDLIAFLSVAKNAWKRDPEYYRLWGNLNMALCMWLWMKLYIDKERTSEKNYSVLDIPQFKECLMSLSADAEYVNWLFGRKLGDNDRAPAYRWIKRDFLRRLKAISGSKRFKLPKPAWENEIP
jgi:hypothetical protein